MTKKLVLVVAPTFKEYEQYCYANGLDPNNRRDARFCMKRSDLATGFSSEQVRVVFTANLGHGPDAAELRGYVQAVGYGFEDLADPKPIKKR